MATRKKLTDYLSPQKEGDGFVFIGEEAKVFIPQRYEVHDLLFIDQQIKTLAIFEIFINGETDGYGLLLPALIEMSPSSTYTQKNGNVDYLVAVFKKGDLFINNKTLIEQGYLISKMFIEFNRNGNVPSFLSYNQLATLMDTAQITCGVSLGVPHAVFEMMNAHQCRDPDNLNIKYRHTDMKKKPTYLGLRDTHVRDSTSSRLLGSHVLDGINTSIINQADQSHEVEDLLRQ